MLSPQHFRIEQDLTMGRFILKLWFKKLSSITIKALQFKKIRRSSNPATRSSFKPMQKLVRAQGDEEVETLVCADIDPASKQMRSSPVILRSPLQPNVPSSAHAKKKVVGIYRLITADCGCREGLSALFHKTKKNLQVSCSDSYTGEGIRQKMRYGESISLGCDLGKKVVLDSKKMGKEIRKEKSHLALDSTYGYQPRSVEIFQEEERRSFRLSTSSSSCLTANAPIRDKDFSFPSTEDTFLSSFGHTHCSLSSNSSTEMVQMMPVISNCERRPLILSRKGACIGAQAESPDQYEAANVVTGKESDGGRSSSDFEKRMIRASNARKRRTNGRKNHLISGGVHVYQPLEAKWNLSEKKIHWHTDDELDTSSATSGFLHKGCERFKQKSRLDGARDSPIPCGRDEGALNLSEPRASRRLSVDGSVAVVKHSKDPLSDFCNSMTDIVVEKQITSFHELAELLQCFLHLNSSDHHDTILQAFCQVWEEVLELNIKSSHVE